MEVKKGESRMQNQAEELEVLWREAEGEVRLLEMGRVDGEREVKEVAGLVTQCQMLVRAKREEVRMEQKLVDVVND